MNNIAVCKVQERGYITIPQVVRKKLGVKRGESIAFILKEDGEIAVEKVAAGKKDLDSVMNLLDDMSASLKAKGVSFDDLMQTGREERKKLFAEMYPDLV